MADVVVPEVRFKIPADLKDPPEVRALKAGVVAFLNTVAFLVQVVRLWGANLFAPRA